MTAFPETTLNESHLFDPNNCGFETEEDRICQAGLIIHSKLLPVIVAAGLFGNFFNFVIMMTAANRQSACCLFFAALSVSDNIVLFGTMIHLIKEKIVVDRLTDLNWCTSYSYSFNFGSSCSGYFIVIITFLRLNAVCKIFKKQPEITRKTALILILVIFVVCMILNLPIIFTANLLGRSACVSYSRLKQFSNVWVFVVTVLFFVIPVALVTYWNIRIYRKIHKRSTGTMDSTQSNSLQQDLTDSSENNTSRNQDSSGISSNVSNKDTERKVSKMIMLISAAFVFLSLPQYLRHAILLKLKREEVKFLIFHVTNTLFNVNHAINFYLYCLSGAKFRNDFLKILKTPYQWIKQ